MDDTLPPIPSSTSTPLPKKKQRRKKNRMNRYAKIKLVNSTTKSRSIDFSDLQSFPLETKKPIKIQDTNFKRQEPKSQDNAPKLNDSSPNLEENDEQEQHPNTDEGQFEFMPVKLIRNSSVSAAKSSSNRFNLEKQGINPLQSAVKRAFSMRRSSSVSERYCRIHDQCVTLASPLEDENFDEEMKTRSVNKKKKKYSSGSILKACKRLLRI